MRENKYFEEFGKPFPASDVSWRLQYVDKEKMQGFAVPYLDARAIANRLDAVVGQNNWKDTYIPWHNCVVDDKQKASQLCTISIYDEERCIWIDKTDGAEDTDTEPIKGGLSDAFKRAAVKWNIGRYLYSFEPVWVTAEKRGRAFVIAKSENAKLENAYNGAIARLCGAEAPKQTSTPPAQKQNTAPPPAQPAATRNTDENADVYEIRNIKVQDDRISMMLFGKGKQFQAFMNGKDERLKIGTRIKNVSARRAQNAYGTYAILNSYDIAA